MCGLPRSLFASVQHTHTTTYTIPRALLVASPRSAICRVRWRYLVTPRQVCRLSAIDLVASADRSVSGDLHSEMLNGDRVRENAALADAFSTFTHNPATKQDLLRFAPPRASTNFAVETLQNSIVGTYYIESVLDTF